MCGATTRRSSGGVYHRLSAWRRIGDESRRPPQAARTIARKSAAFSEAPPTRAPPTSATARISRGVARLDRAAVEDRRDAAALAQPLDHGGAHGGVDLVDLLQRRRQAGADGPDRLIGHGEGLAGERSRQGAADLARTTATASPASRWARVSPTQMIGSSPARSGGLDLGGDQGVGLAELLTALGVAEDDQGRAGVLQHLGRDAAGEGARASARQSWPPISIGPPSTTRPCVRSGSRAGTGRRGPRRLGFQISQRLQAPGLGQIGGQAVHLPVAGDQLHGLFHALCLGAVSRDAKPAAQRLTLAGRGGRPPLYGAVALFAVRPSGPFDDFPVPRLRQVQVGRRPVCPADHQLRRRRRKPDRRVQEPGRPST